MRIELRQREYVPPRSYEYRVQQGLITHLSVIIYAVIRNPESIISHMISVTSGTVINLCFGRVTGSTHVLFNRGEVTIMLF